MAFTMTFLVFILILSVLVLVHEAGHFLAAKKAGIKVEEFAFGLPFTKPLLSKKRGETVYSVYPLIFGGFVKLYGEDGEIKGKTDGRAYFEKSIFQRMTVLLAGVTMNLILAVVCFSFLYFIWGIPTKTGKVMVESVSQGSPAELAGIIANDQIVAIDQESIETGDELIKITGQKADEPVQLEVNREGQALVVELVPRKNPPSGEGPLGVLITDSEFRKYPFYLMPFLGIKEGFIDSFNWGKMILSALKDLVLSLVLHGKVPSEIAGPVGIYQITGVAAKAGWLAVFQLVGIISVNLAIVNVLPIPAMDGGRLVFLFYEMVFKKRAPAKAEAFINSFGMILLLGLMALITVNDILRISGK